MLPTWISPRSGSATLPSPSSSNSPERSSSPYTLTVILSCEPSRYSCAAAMPVTARRKASTIDSCLSIRILHLSHPASGVAHRDPASESPGHLQQDSVVRVIDTGRASVRVAPLERVASAETEEAIGLPGGTGGRQDDVVVPIDPLIFLQIIG